MRGFYEIHYIGRPRMTRITLQSVLIVFFFFFLLIDGLAEVTNFNNELLKLNIVERFIKSNAFCLPITLISYLKKQLNH